MTVTVFKARDLAAAKSLSDRAIARLLEEMREVDVLVLDTSHQQARQLELAASGTVGADVVTYSQWLAALWELEGDGTQIVDGATRQLLVRDPLAHVIEMLPSPKLTQQAASFVAEVLGQELGAGVEFTDTEQRLMAMSQAYGAEISKRGLVEETQVEQRLNVGALAGRALVVESDGEWSCHARRFIKRVGEAIPIVVIERSLDADATEAQAGNSEIEELGRVLYSAQPNVEPTGKIMVGEAHGAHIEGQLVCQLVNWAREKGAELSDIAIVFRDASEAVSAVLPEMARAGIPFTCSYATPAYQTPFGSAFAALSQACYLEGDASLGVPSADEAALLESLAGFIATPFSGVAPRDARAIQGRWRQFAGSTPEQCMKDIREGFAQGNVTAHDTAPLFEKLVNLLDATPEERISLMFASARDCGRNEAALVDDFRVGSAMLAYLAACRELGISPLLDDLANAPVPLQRAYKFEESHVSVVSQADVPGLSAPYVIFANLDAAHHPMAVEPGPFDALLAKLGLLPTRDEALRQRLGLLDVLAAAQDGFAFYRVCNDELGVESVPSTLFEELLAPYRREEDSGKDPSALPNTLLNAGCTRSLSEAGLFRRALTKAGAEHFAQTARGKIEKSDGSLLLQDARNRELALSPTALEAYRLCPYMWFVSRKVGYNSLDSQLDQIALGNLVHNVFERFYIELGKRGERRVCSQNLQSSLELAATVFDALVEEGGATAGSGLYPSTNLDELELSRVRSDVLAFIARDAEFLPGFAPTYFELQLGRAPELQYAGVPVRGRVDRIDVDSQGNAVIIDYKLSKLAFGYGGCDSEKIPLRIQADIYALVAQRHFDNLYQEGELAQRITVVGSVYRSYADNICRGAYAGCIEWGSSEGIKNRTDAASGPDSVATYHEYLAKVEEEVAAHIEGLRRGDISPRPLAKDACTYCPYADFCTRKEG